MVQLDILQQLQLDQSFMFFFPKEWKMSKPIQEKVGGDEESDEHVNTNVLTCTSDVVD